MVEAVRQRVRERRARQEEPVIDSMSSLEEEEDPVVLRSSSLEKEDEGTTTPSQPELDDDSEPSPPLQVHRLVTCSTFGKPIARPKRKATKKKAGEPSSSLKKQPRVSGR